MDLQDLRIFWRVSALQSLSAVGIELGLTTGTISKRIQALEDELQVRLFDRTTRSIRITEEGEKLLEFAGRILKEVEAAKAAVTANVEAPRGRVRVLGPMGYASGLLSPAISAFIERYPNIQVHIDFTDRFGSAAEESYDVLIRAGTLNDSSLIAKRLAPDPQILVASPAYLARHGEPKRIADLVEHNCLVRGDVTTWTLCDGTNTTVVRASGSLRSNCDEMLRHAALEGHGILCTSQLRVEDALAIGTLRRVLGTVEVSPSSALWALYPSGKHVLPKVRVLLDFLADWCVDLRAASREGAPVRVLRPTKATAERRTRAGAGD